jgi:hypothetical protein
VASPLQPLAGKLPPVPLAGFAKGNEGGRGAREARYVHNPIATSSVKVFCGTTLDGERIERKKRRNELTDQLFNSMWALGREKEAKAFISCGNRFRKYAAPCGGYRLEPLGCNSPFCVNCAVPRSNRLIRKILPLCRKEGKRYWFLNLTTPHVQLLSRDAVDRLVEQFATLRASSVWAKVKCVGGTWVGVSGGIYSLECTRNEGFRYQRTKDTSGRVLITRTPDSSMRGWHLHLHTLVELPEEHPDEWLDQLKAEWFRITEGARNLRLTRVFAITKSGRTLYGKVNHRSLKELCKYVTKAVSFAWSPALVDEFLNAFKNVRRVQAFGSFFGALKDAEREPGEECDELKCSCGGTHARKEFRATRTIVHIRDTMRRADGFVQMRFEFAAEMRESVPESPPPWYLTPEEVWRDAQTRIEFAGPMPAEQVD